MTKDELKTRVCAAIDKRSQEIIDLGDYLFKNPELGYKERKAAAAVQEKFKALGLNFRSGLAITGIKARMEGRKSGVTVDRKSVV